MPVVLVSEQGPEEYELQEMNAASRDRYLDKLQKRMATDASGKAMGIKRFEGMQADLISQCMFHVKTGLLVSDTVIQTWPASVVTELFNAAQEMNRLKGEEAETETKND